jgi:Rrf2 family nitric oxide-sensitive transcriptional repressor
MQLTLFTDYALRTLLYLGSHPDQVVPATAISAAYGISAEHTVKAAKWLTQQGYVHAQRGKGGGLRLAQDPKSIVLGALIRKTEPHLDLLECFDPARDSCPVSPACRLKGALFRARAAFLEVLDQYTLADLLVNADAFAQLLPAQALRRKNG